MYQPSKSASFASLRKTNHLEIMTAGQVKHTLYLKKYKYLQTFKLLNLNI